MRTSIVLAGAALVALAGAFAASWFRDAATALQVREITPDLHLLSNDFGGNVAVLRTGVGSVVVDTMTFGLQGEVIQRLALELTGEPVTTIINSHYHLDHTHGNPAFPAGTRVLATERSLHHLRQRDAGTFSDAAARLLPNETIAGERELALGDKTLRLLHPGRGHTDGDLVVLFVEDRALHAGDLFFNRLYPNIDLEAGGSVVAWGDTLDRLLALPFDHVIPGHGKLADAEGLRQFQAFIRQLAEVGSYAASIDATLADTLVNARLNEDAGYQPMRIAPLFSLDRDFVIKRAWEEATGNYRLYEGFAEEGGAE